MSLACVVVALFGVDCGRYLLSLRSSQRLGETVLLQSGQRRMGCDIRFIGSGLGLVAALANALPPRLVADQRRRKSSNTT